VHKHVFLFWFSESKNRQEQTGKSNLNQIRLFEPTVTFYSQSLPIFENDSFAVFFGCP